MLGYQSSCQVFSVSNVSITKWKLLGTSSNHEEHLSFLSSIIFFEIYTDILFNLPQVDVLSIIQSELSKDAKQ